MSLFSLTATWQKVTAIVGAVAIIATVVGATIRVDTRYNQTKAVVAVDTEVQLVGVRLDNKIIMDKINYWEVKIDRIREKYDGKAMPPEAVQRINDAYREIKQLERKLKKG
jgi:hypothetical protein